MAEAAAARNTAVGLFIDEVQYLSSSELAAVIVACHEIAQRNLPFLFIGAGLPQVASLAPTHFRLRKELAGERATATVQRLDGEGVVAEIRRMLGGESGGDAAERHARELLATA